MTAINEFRELGDDELVTRLGESKAELRPCTSTALELVNAIRATQDPNGRSMHFPSSQPTAAMQSKRRTNVESGVSREYAKDAIVQ
jgi:hypothetical protein